MNEIIRKRILESAKDYKLTPKDTERFLRFAENWNAISGQTFDGGYRYEWADRFKKSEEYINPVATALFALVQTDGERKAQMIYTNQLIDNYGYKPDAAALRATRDINEVTAKYGTLKGRKTHRLCKKSDKKPSKIIGKLPNFDVNLIKLI